MTVVILAFLPPRIDADAYFFNDFKKLYPDVDFLYFQANITRNLNDTLKTMSKENGFLFLNVNESFESDEGGLKKELSDGGHHVHPKFNFIIKERLISLLLLSTEPCYTGPLE